MNKEVIIKIGGTANTGKSTVAVIIEKALTEAGIDFRYVEDDLELIERTPAFVARTMANLEYGKIKDYGITANIKTCQLNRESYTKGVSEEDIKKF